MNQPTLKVKASSRHESQATTTPQRLVKPTAARQFIVAASPAAFALSGQSCFTRRHELP
jgi:hypothetical protein